LRASGEEIIPVNSGSFHEANNGFRWENAPQYMAEMVFVPPTIIGNPHAELTAAFAPEIHSRIDFQLFLGVQHTAGLYSFQPVPQDNSFILEDVKAALVLKLISAEKFVRQILHGSSSDTKEGDDHTAIRPGGSKRAETPISEYEYEHTRSSWSPESEYSPEPPKIFRSLQALASVLEVYKFMPESRLSIKAAQRPLYLSNWFTYDQRYLDPFEPYLMNRSQTFACIAMFESGSLNIQPATLSQVMAMSIENSIYVAAPLLSDPTNTYRDNTIKRVVGNVGKPGIAMMIPPSNPKMRVLPHDSWHCINHNQFNGVSEDCFQHTTLHLSFTDWEMPIDIGNRGGRDSEVFFLETPVALHDRGIWVADLDILGSLSDPKLQTKCNYRPCPGPHSRYHASVDFASIDCWEELLERPLEEGIVRAHKNWQARLAAAVLGVQRGHKTFVLSKDFCWNCYEVHVREGHDVFEGNELGPIPNKLAKGAEEQIVEDTSPDHYEDDSFEGDDTSSLNFNTIVKGRDKSETWRKEVFNLNVIYIM
jgi:hypothetical protein